MSYIQFQQKCADYSEEWNATCGIVGVSFIAQPPKKCPKCGSKNISKIADVWKITSIAPLRILSEEDLKNA